MGSFRTPTVERPSGNSAHPGSNLSEEEEDPDATQLNGDAIEEAVTGNDSDVVEETQQFESGEASGEPAEWGGVHPDAVMHRLKLIKPELLSSLRMKGFYKSYCSWSKMSMEQKNKAIAWFLKLPEPLRCKFFF